jgi:hypothetical protein
MHTAEAQKMNPPPRCGREHFTGYIADLIDEVTNYMKFNYSLCVGINMTYIMVINFI